MSLHRPTVHDLSSLSLHPTGARAKRKEKNVVQDARGNLIAKDAAGWGRVVRRRRDEEDEEENEEDEQMMGKGKGKDISLDDKLDLYANPEPKDVRARKRRRIAHDVDFLEGHENDGNKPELPTPSSVIILSFFLPSTTHILLQDLLKQIHHFASHYYASQNMLFDSGREYRKAKKARTDKKKAEAIQREQSREMDENEGTDVEEDKESDGEEEQEEESEDNDETKGKNNRKSKKRAKKGEKNTLRRDMYKVFDGSALMALGTSSCPLLISFTHSF